MGVGIGEEIELVGETVGGDGAEDVLAVEPEVAEIGVDGGAGASESAGDLHGGASLAPEVVRFEDASAASRGWWFVGGDWVGRSLRWLHMF